MIDTNIRIVLENGNTLEYRDPKDLGIKLNRIIDDFTDPSKRFGEFSYTFSIPITKANRIAWEFPDAKGRTNIFKGKSYPCKVFNGSELLLEGIIELTGFDREVYKCVFFSNYTQLLDDLKGKKLTDLTTFSTIAWDYENTIVQHIRADYKTSDDSTHVSPLTFYQSPFWSGATSQMISRLETNPEVFMAYKQGDVSPIYYSALPPAFFLIRILENMFKEVGWSLGGSFFQRQDLKKIIIPFTGDNEAYSGAILSGSTGSTLNLNKLLPNMDCITLLTSVINTFNLYFTIDTKAKQINFETYNVLFNGSANAYDITRKVDYDSIEISEPDDEPTISFTDDGNNSFIGAYNRIFDYSDFTRLPAFIINTNNRYRYVGLQVPNSYYGEPNELRAVYKPKTLEKLWNKTFGTGKDIKLGFSHANLLNTSFLHQTSLNSTNWTNAKHSFNEISFTIPLISPQTASDNNGKPFTKDQLANYVEGNNPKDQDYSGGVKLLYYYGFPKYDLAITGSTPTIYKDWLWVGISTGGTATAPTFARVPIPFASPFKLISKADKDRLLALFSEPDFDRYGVQGAEAHNLLLTYYTVGKIADPFETTNFSLTLGDNPIFPNLYSSFHESKYLTLRNGHLFEANMRMNAFDWSQMQINTPIRYDNEFYRLVAIKNYDPVNRTASISLLKDVGIHTGALPPVGETTTTTTTTTTLAPFYTTLTLAANSDTDKVWQLNMSGYHLFVAHGTDSRGPNTQASPSSSFTVNASTLKLSNSGIAEYPVEVNFIRNGVPEETVNYDIGDHILYHPYNFTNVHPGDSLMISVNES